MSSPILFGLIFTLYNGSSILLTLIVVLLYEAFIYWLCWKTTYTLDPERLTIRWLWMSRTIPIDTILHVRKDDYPAAGVRYGTTFRGLVIVRHTQQTLFISPAKEDEFIEALNFMLQKQSD